MIEKHSVFAEVLNLTVVFLLANGQFGPFVEQFALAGANERLNKQIMISIFFITVNWPK